MDVCQPRVRRRGFFLHSSDGGEPDTGEHENPEGFGVRVRVNAGPAPRRMSSGGRSGHTSRIETTDPQIRSGSVTGSRQRAHLPR
jgi:hypothetical protein